MRMVGAPIVYVGPTLPAEAVQRAYPGCIVRPPIARGDLYRDRMLRGAVFLIVDGVFFQHLAISPREIADVISDGAFVAGASSMGALRAAECWPLGMRGVGTIYRLFRSGVLTSDDEVAVTFADGEHQHGSVALINVRHAVRRAVRARSLDVATARAIVDAAARLFYAERHWPQILLEAGCSARSPLTAELTRYDLKALDAARALTRLKRWVGADPELLTRPRASATAFVSSDDARERTHEAGAAASTPELRLELARSLFASGRYRLHAALVAAAADTGRAAPRSDPAPAAVPNRTRDRRELDAALAQHGFESNPNTRAIYNAISRAVARPGALLRAFATDPAPYADHAWLALAMTDELDAELFRLRALRESVARNMTAGVAPTPARQHAVELKIATTHGHASWDGLMSALQDCPAARALVIEYAQRAALAGAASNTS